MGVEAAGGPQARRAKLFAALGDETRLAILERVGNGAPLSITLLSAGFSLTRQGVARHLVVLEEAGLLRRERVGRESLFRVEPSGFREAQSYLARAAAQWDEAIERLEAHLGAEAGTNEDETGRAAPIRQR